MARLPRFFLPDTPQHVIQRGNNRQAIFEVPADRAFYKDCLAFAARRHGIVIHAYVLMTNHVHLLVTPESATSLPRTMQSVGRVYVRYFNSMRERSGTLWEGRYKAAIVDSDRYLLACMRYIEQNAVRAGLVDRPERYPWSSFGANALGTCDPLVSAHRVYRELGSSLAARRSQYRALFDQPVAESEISAIRDATQNAWALGDAQFCRAVDGRGRRAERARVGRRARTGSGPGKSESDRGSHAAKWESDPSFASFDSPTVKLESDPSFTGGSAPPRPAGLRRR